MTSTSLGLSFLSKSAGHLLVAPGQFFSQQGKAAHWAYALGIIFITAFVAAGTALILKTTAPSWFGIGLFVFNAVGMILISAAFGFLAIRLIHQEAPVSFGRFFSIYAFAAALPTLLSALPGSFMATETWKWCLIGIGLTRGIGLLWRQAVVVIGSSIALTILFFWSLMLMVH